MRVAVRASLAKLSELFLTIAVPGMSILAHVLQSARALQGVEGAGAWWASHLSRLLRSDIAHKGLAALDSSDWVQINTNDQTAHWHVLDSHLKPSSCRST